MKKCDACGVEKLPFDFYSKNHRQCKSCCRAKALERSRARGIQPQKRSIYRGLHNANSLRKFNLTPLEYDELKKKQGGKCAICFKERKLYIDHCHRSGKVRGLLCHTCNVGIGFLGDDIEHLSNAIDYLSQFPSTPNLP